jgi:hypothetical protein
MTFAGEKVYIQYNTTDANSELTVDRLRILAKRIGSQAM